MFIKPCGAQPLLAVAIARDGTIDAKSPLKPMHWLEKATEITHLSSVLSHHVYKSFSSFSNYSHRNIFINIIFRIFNFRKKSLIRK